MLPGSVTALCVIGPTLYLITLSTPASQGAFPTLALTSVGVLSSNAGPVVMADNNGVNFGSLHVLTGTDLNTYFTQSLADILVGDKLEVVRDVTGSVVRDKFDTQKFLANTDDVALSIVLQWSAPDNARWGDIFADRARALRRHPCRR